MHFSEEDLRSSLQRKDPGEDFTQRVMARIQKAESEATAPRSWLWPLRFRPLFTGAMAAAVLVAASWLGIAQYQHRQGERAKEQAILAMEIAHAKLNQVFERVRASSSNEVKFRRDHL